MEDEMTCNQNCNQGRNCSCVNHEAQDDVGEFACENFSPKVKQFIEDTEIEDAAIAKTIQYSVLALFVIVTLAVLYASIS